MTPTSKPAGWPLGYGARWRTGTDCEIAVVPVGYHDGFPRSLSDRGEVLVGGRRAKVVGTISMDLTLVDITGIPRVSPGDPVVLLGSGTEAGEDSIDAQELARVIKGVPNVEVVAEFAFGTSHKAPLGSPSEKGRIGNVHFALGDNKNAYPGGQNSSPLHLDGVLRNATLEIIEGGQGGYIFRDGKWDV